MSKLTRERECFREFQKKIYIQMIESDCCRLSELDDRFIEIMENGNPNFGIKNIKTSGCDSGSFMIIEFEDKMWKIEYDSGSYSISFDYATMVEVKPVERTITEYQTV